MTVKNRCLEHLANVICQWRNFLCQTAHKRLSENNTLLLSRKLTAIYHLLNFCRLYFLPLPEKFLAVLSCLSPSLLSNFIRIFGHYLHVNHNQHVFQKPLSLVLPQKISIKSLSRIHFKTVLEGLDLKLSFDSFFRQTFYRSWNCALSTW